MDSITLISSDNHKIEIDLKCAQRSNYLKEKLLDSNNKKMEIQLKEVKYDILKKVVEYLNYYKNRTIKEIPKPTPSGDLYSFLDDWDFNFINNMNLDDTFSLMNAASELGVQPLLDLASSKVASILKTKNLDEIRNMFSGGCDLSEKELKKYSELQL